MTDADFKVEIEREDRFGPFTYSLFISPAPRFGGRVRFAWTLRGAQRKAQRWLKSARLWGPKSARDRYVIDTIGGAS